MTTGVITADAHVQEPDDLWTSRVSCDDAYRVPVFRRQSGNKLYFSNGVLHTMTPDYHRPELGESGEPDLIKPDDVDGYLADLDRDGVWGAALHPNVGAFSFDISEPGLGMTCARIYNDHVSEIYTSPRLNPGAVVPVRDIAGAVREIERVAGMGFRFLELPIHAPEGLPYFLRRYDPIWAAASDHGLTIVMHIGGGGLRRAKTSATGNSTISFRPTVSVAGVDPDDVEYESALTAKKTAEGGFGGFPAQCSETIPALLGGGVFERFPNLHIVFAVVGARWLASLMDTMDAAWQITRGLPDWNRTFFQADGSSFSQYLPGELKLEWRYPLTPSEYVRRQVHVTFMDDWAGLRNREITGVEALLWANDYPHVEGTWPDSPTAMQEQSKRAELSDSERAAIFGGTAAKLLGFDVPAEIPPTNPAA